MTRGYSHKMYRIHQRKNHNRNVRKQICLNVGLFHRLCSFKRFYAYILRAGIIYTSYVKIALEQAHLSAISGENFGGGPGLALFFSPAPPPNFPRSRPQVSLLEGYLNVRSLNNSCSKDVCMKTFEGAQTIKKVPENTQLQLIP